MGVSKVVRECLDEAYGVQFSPPGPVLALPERVAECAQRAATSTLRPSSDPARHD